MFLVESFVFTFYFSNFTRVIASWRLTKQLSDSGLTPYISKDRNFSIKTDLSKHLVSEVTSVNRMIRFVIIAYYVTGIPMVI